MKHFTKISYAAIATVLGSLPGTVLAQNKNPFETAQNLAGTVGKEAGLGEPKSLTEIIGNIINVALGFLGIVLLGYLLYAGFLWMTAGGEKEKVEKAQAMIKNSIIGLIIIVAAFAISSFVLGSLVNATKQ